jgi:hypothetical protein
LVNHPDLWLFNLKCLLPHCSHRRLVLVTREEPMQYRPSTRCSLGENVGRFVVVAQNVMDLEPVELAFC